MSDAKKTTKHSPYTDSIARLETRHDDHAHVYGADHPTTKFYGSLKEGVKALARGDHAAASAHLDAAEQHAEASHTQGMSAARDSLDRYGIDSRTRDFKDNLREVRAHVAHQAGFTSTAEGGHYHRLAAGGYLGDVADSGPERVHHHLANAYINMGNAVDLKQPHRFKSVQEDLDHAKRHAASLPASHELHRDIAHAQAMHDTLKGSTMSKADTENRFQGLAEASLLAFTRR